MGENTFVGQLDLWVSQYIAGLCLVTIIVWCIGTYLRNPKWEQPVRDAAMFFAVLGVLTVFQALRYQKVELFNWPPLTWCCFTILVLMEILWLSFLLDQFVQMIQALRSRLPKEFRKGPAPLPSSLRRPR